MKQTRTQMGMHVTIDVSDQQVKKADLDHIFEYFTYVDETFSTFKATSQISRLNAGELTKSQLSRDVQEVLHLCEQTKQETAGYFDVVRNGQVHPLGLVKGWAIRNAAQMLLQRGMRNFLIDAGGDIQVSGMKSESELWKVGVQNPFNPAEIIKILSLKDCGIATSGTAVRGHHIYDPHNGSARLSEIVSLTVIGPNVYEADRFATPAFAMGVQGIRFIERQANLEGYMIDKDGTATYTSGFSRYVLQS